MTFVHVEGYLLKFADGRQRLGIFTKRRSVRLLKETLPYNKQLTNLTYLVLYQGILALGRFCMNLAVLGPYCHDLRPMFPSTVLALGWQEVCNLVTKLCCHSLYGEPFVPKSQMAESLVQDY